MVSFRHADERLLFPQCVYPSTKSFYHIIVFIFITAMTFHMKHMSSYFTITMYMLKFQLPSR